MGDREETRPESCALESCCGGPMFITKLQDISQVSQVHILKWSQKFVASDCLAAILNMYIKVGMLEI